MANWEATANCYSKLIQKPAMKQQHLQRPPFKFIFDIFVSTNAATKFTEGLFSEEELKADYYDTKEKKITYLKRIIELTELVNSSKIDVSPNKIVAGLEPEKTNDLLQQAYQAATSGKNFQPLINKVLGKGPTQPASQKPAKTATVAAAPVAATPAVVAPKETKKKVAETVEPTPVTIKQEELDKKHGKLVEETLKQQDVVKEATSKKQEQAAPITMSGHLGGKKGADNSQSIMRLGEADLDIDALKAIVQSICQSTNPLSKSLEFINDDIESMNQEYDQWTKQYRTNRQKYEAELAITEEATQQTLNKLDELEYQVNDKRAKIQNLKSQIHKNEV